MKVKPRVVFDTNIFISSIIFGGNPRQCLELARENEIELYISRAILLELSEKLEEKFLWQSKDTKEVIEGILMFASLVSPKKKINHIKENPKDNMILECAVEAKADFLISGDKKHLLALKTFKNIKIISAKQFLDIFFQAD
ncbi:MAG: hypothetical protein ACD_30C00021G0003 [uncultured bacterium]|uniref:PIN domain-containing protein n=3 Tax=Candidatus Daviesiibacteriota TaxID=1752718 RepID=A0A0G0ER43_9BACT|nr:MAG: hypothetical protein ACD_30C00021G0003 [uncultured bacterium]KKQ07977.1 MAG: hypothetical protein US19_C0034G0013 [Candidatus Daviesbacteria bacterium GW2011_GWB1_36_5]KKQ16161.1 MAG: hypothetical protein US28_C0004G0003 [Candidatus Daviesbacteria bacterium GW2011_GWA1_36_8]OGE33239.1 MAG: putative toxin-antitoxin system toxin component, PIN family [Candidatus Daviesbacteria bacterium RIFCSPHIGHO2_02_FULL_37_9]OGE36140.1 MAG: putative toxin-antitoxin system toxin component, PIN family [